MSIKEQKADKFLSKRSTNGVKDIPATLRRGLRMNNTQRRFALTISTVLVLALIFIILFASGQANNTVVANEKAQILQEVIGAVLRAAKAQGLLVIADTKLPNFRFLTLEDLADLLPLIDYITPNEDEARYYTGRQAPEEMTQVFLDYGVKNVIVKLGAKGCYFRGAEGSFSLPPCEIRAVDATGAGDNFVAGFACELLHGSSTEAALRFANACGAICTTAVGAATALKSRDQVLSFLGGN